VLYRDSMYKTASAQDQTYVDDKWHHVAATLSGNGMKLYVDGELIDANPTVARGSYYTGYWRFGYDNIENWYGINVYRPEYHGIIEDISVWNKELSQSQIHNIMNTELKGNESGLVSYWKFNEGTGSTIMDASGHLNTATLIGNIDWIEARAPIAVGEMSLMYNLAAVWDARKSSSSTIMTIQDDNISGTDFI